LISPWSNPWVTGHHGRTLLNILAAELKPHDLQPGALHAHRHTTGYGYIYQERFKSFPIEQDDAQCTSVRRAQRIAEFAQKAPWLVLFPGIAISLVVFASNLLGDAVRDKVDPRLRGA
jgi:hypothetical protein